MHFSSDEHSGVVEAYTALMTLASAARERDWQKSKKCNNQTNPVRSRLVNTHFFPLGLTIQGTRAYSGFVCQAGGGDYFVGDARWCQKKKKKKKNKKHDTLERALWDSAGEA
jgi:hypothetical protein